MILEIQIPSHFDYKETKRIKRILDSEDKEEAYKILYQYVKTGVGNSSLKI